MKTQASATAANIIGALLLVASIPAQSAEVKMISAIGIYSTLEELRANFELVTGHKLTIVRETLKRVQDGETADLVFFPDNQLTV